MFATPNSTEVSTTYGACENSFVSRNAATTVGCAVVATVPVLGTVGMVLGAPGTTAMIAALGGSAIYIGHRQANGQSIIPGRSASPESTDSAPAPAAVAA
jgi:hypothetical protein